MRPNLLPWYISTSNTQLTPCKIHDQCIIHAEDMKRLNVNWLKLDYFWGCVSSRSSRDSRFPRRRKKRTTQKEKKCFRDETAAQQMVRHHTHLFLMIPSSTKTPLMRVHQQVSTIKQEAAGARIPDTPARGDPGGTSCHFASLGRKE